MKTNSKYFDIQLLLLTVFFIVAVNSCKKDNNKDFSTPVTKNRIYNNVSEIGAEELDALDDFLSEEYDAYLYIQENHSFSNTISSNELVLASFLSVSNVASINIGDGLIEISEDVDNGFYWYNDGESEIGAFDNYVECKIYDDEEELYFSESVYLPLILEPTIGSNFMIDTFSQDSIVVGDTIFWNVDENNSKGVFIRFGFSKNFQTATGYSEYDDTENIVLVDDEDGFYVIPDDMFTDIPITALVKISLIRGDYISVEDSQSDGKELCILGFSHAFHLIPYSDN